MFLSWFLKLICLSVLDIISNVAGKVNYGTISNFFQEVDFSYKAYFKKKIDFLRLSQPKLFKNKQKCFEKFLFLKNFDCESRKKSIFFKNKHCMRNLLGEKLDNVVDFTSLVACEIKSKTERQVSFRNQLKNAV